MNKFELDPGQMPSNAKEENDALSDNNDEIETSENELVRCIKFVDEVESSKVQEPAAWEGTELNATVTRSGRVVKPRDRLIDVMSALTEVSTIPGTKAELDCQKQKALNWDWWMLESAVQKK